MGPFRAAAVRIIVRDVSVIGFAGLMLVAAMSFAPDVAFKCAAILALAYAIVLLIRAGRLSADRIEDLEAWHSLDPADRPDDEEGRRWAYDDFKILLLSTAKSSSLASIGCFCIAIVAHAVM